MKKIILPIAVAKQAFTLMELMIVIVIIGILATVGMVMFGGQTTKAKINTTKQAFTIAKKNLALALTTCRNGIDYIWQKNGNSCLSGPVNGDQIAWGVYNDMKSEIYKTNPYDSSAKSVEWNQSYGAAYCPISRSAKIPKGQVVVGYGNNGSKNYCRIGGGNMSCIRANIGDKDGNDFYLEAEFNICDF